MKTFGIIALVMLGIYAIYKAYSVSHVTKDLDTLLTENPVILDVRTQFEYNDGHIPGSINIPLSRLRTAPLSSFDRKRPIITCCSHGLRSVKAVEVLFRRGFSNAYNGGAWTDLEKKLDEKNR